MTSYSAHPAEFALIADECECTTAEGPGKRYAIWFQGCSIGCLGCVNPSMLDPAGGGVIPVKEIVRRVRRSQEQHGIRGVTFLGGEPFDQSGALLTIATAVHESGLDTLLFTGHTLDFLHSLRDSTIDAILMQTDVLVDGPYIQARHTHSLYLRGSDNQRFHFLGARLNQQLFTGPNRVEVRIKGDTLTITGFPVDFSHGNISDLHVPTLTTCPLKKVK